MSGELNLHSDVGQLKFRLLQLSNPRMLPGLSRHRVMDVYRMTRRALAASG
jgi:hypothetical protein